MEKEEDFETLRNKAQSDVLSQMNDITKETRRTIKGYIRKYYLSGFARAMVYLGLDSADTAELLNEMDNETKAIIMEKAELYNKNDPEVIAEVEHMLTSSGMNLNIDYQFLASNLTKCGIKFAEDAIKKFREETPIFKKKLDSYIFDFSEIKYIDDRSMHKILELVDQITLATALKGTDSEVQNKFFNSLSKHEADMLKEDMEFMGPVPAVSVEECQAKIMNLIYKMVLKGVITLPEKYDESELVKSRENKK